MNGTRLGGTLVVLIAVFVLSPWNGRFWWVGLIAGLAAIACITPFTLQAVHSIATHSRPMRAASEALLMVAAMVVFGFSAIYLGINRHGTQFEGLHTRMDAVYFTMTTVATVGYGDVHPTGQLARGLVSLQMLFDLTLLAFSVKLLSTAANERAAGRDSL